jgi:hypothetical protein
MIPCQYAADPSSNDAIIGKRCRQLPVDNLIGRVLRSAAEFNFPLFGESHFHEYKKKVIAQRQGIFLCIGMIAPAGFAVERELVMQENARSSRRIRDSLSDGSLVKRAIMLEVEPRVAISGQENDRLIGGSDFLGL